MEAKYTHKKFNLLNFTIFLLFCWDLAFIEIYALLGKIKSVKTLSV